MQNTNSFVAFLLFPLMARCLYCSSTMLFSRFRLLSFHSLLLRESLSNFFFFFLLLRCFNLSYRRLPGHEFNNNSKDYPIRESPSSLYTNTKFVERVHLFFPLFLLSCSSSSSFHISSFFSPSQPCVIIFN